jgi:predicted Zn-dependent protease
LLELNPLHILKEILLKTLRPIFALALAAALFAGCSKSDTNTNSSNTGNSNVKTSSSSTPATTTPTNSSASSSSNEGEVFTHQEGGLQFTAPANWKSKKDEDALTVMTSDETLSVVFWVPKGDDFNQAVDDLSKQLDSVIKNSKVTSPGQETMHNGMKAYTASGTGEVDDEQIVWEVDILQAKKPVFVVSFAAPAQFSKHASEYKQLLASIKKVN